MKVISSWGLRGGVGNTSMLAMLGDALHAMGEPVLLIDLNRSDMLRLHFNIPFSDRHGWAAASLARLPWHEQAYFLEEGLWLLPYGRDARQGGGSHKDLPEDPDAFWCSALGRLAERFSWVLFDLPSGGGEFPLLRKRSDLDLLVATADAGCHVLLAQTQFAPETRMFVSAFDPSRPLSRDLLLDWRHRYGSRLLPVLMHRDEAVHEALAKKTNAYARFPDSAAAGDARALATWCMARRGADA